MIYILYWLLKPFKKLNGIKFFIISKENQILNLKVYEILGSKEKILSTKILNDYDKVKIGKYVKFKNYYVV